MTGIDGTTRITGFTREANPLPQVHVRRIEPPDRGPLRSFYAALSPDSREARFLGATPGIGDGTAGFFCGPDHEHREGLIAVALDRDGRETVVGHLCLEPCGPAVAEMAIAVADAWQHRGIGRELLSTGLAWAGKHGFDTMVASMRWSNAPILRLIRSTGLPLTVVEAGAGVVEISVQLGETARPAA